MKIFHLIPRLDYHGAAKQLVLLATGLPRPEFDSLVCVVGGPGPFLAPLKAANIQVEVLNWRRWIDPRPLWVLRQLLREHRPDVVHVWGRTALRLLRLAGAGEAPVAFSAPAVTGRGPGQLDRWLLKRVDRVVVTGDVEAERCLKLGLSDEQLVGVSPGVASANESALPAALPADIAAAKARHIACMGELERPKGFRDAIWAYGILRFLYDDLRLLLIGAGPDGERLEQFARGTRCLEKVHFLGERLDGPALLANAEVVWAPDLADGGVNVALEAMAAGRPVVASRQPGLAEVVLNGQTGLLYPPGDPAELARQTRTLLDDPALGQRMGEAGRKRVAEHYRVDELVRQIGVMYQDIVGRV